MRRASFTRFLFAFRSFAVGGAGVLWLGERRRRSFLFGPGDAVRYMALPYAMTKGRVNPRGKKSAPRRGRSGLGRFPAPSLPQVAGQLVPAHQPMRSCHVVTV